MEAINPTVSVNILDVIVINTPLKDKNCQSGSKNNNKLYMLSTRNPLLI